METLIARFKKLWWIPMFTGLLCIGLGIWVLLAPVSAVPVMAIIFAAVLLAAGILNVSLGGVTRRVSPVWGWALALGLIEIISGVWMLCLPTQQMEIAFIFIAGIMVLVAAVNAVCESFALASRNGWWALWSVFLLFIAITLAIIMFSNPVAWTTATVICLGWALVCFGTYRIGLSITLKKVADKVEKFRGNF